MFSRRRWLAVAAALGVGVFFAPGQSLAGLFKRKRGPQCPCPCPPTRSGPRVTIETTSGQTWPQSGFLASGNVFASSYATDYWVRVYSMEENTTVKLFLGVQKVTAMGTAPAPWSQLV